MLKRLSAQKNLDAFYRDENGSFAVIFTLTIFVLFGVVGLAVDYTHARQAKSSLLEAADAALLAGTKEASQALANGKPNWKREGRRVARKTFRANLEGESHFAARFRPRFSRDGTKVTGTATFNYVYETAISKVVGYPKFNLQQTVKTQVQAANYIDITFLVDNSVSMGIGATEADQRLIYNRLYDRNAKVGCVFGCHVPKNDFEQQFTPDKIYATGAKLRIDVIREALGRSIEQLEKVASEDQFRISVYTFSNHLEEFIAPTTDFDAVKSKLAALDTVKYQNGSPKELGGTYIRAALQDLPKHLKKYGKAGLGLNKNSRKSYIIMMSDGLEDGQWNYYTGVNKDGSVDFDIGSGTLPSWKKNHKAFQNTQPFDPAGCGKLKREKRTLYTAQIRYETAYGFTDQPWNPPIIAYIRTIMDDLEDAFSKCASDPGKHYMIENASAIEPAIDDITDSILEELALRLTH